MAMISDDRIAVRLAAVREHVGFENRHDLDGIMRTFGAAANYDDLSWSERHVGHEQVREFYDDLLRALPDMRIEILREHPSHDTVILEVVIHGRHLGPWRGLAATGRTLEFPLCAIFAFDEQDRLAGEKIYYDRATVLRQLGLFHEPQQWGGRLTAAIMHPLTMLRIAGRKVWRSRS
jgi:steroid delta-isomerase-like uncharacterized protein